MIILLDKISYLLNDASTPFLKSDVRIPESTKLLPFKSVGLNSRDESFHIHAATTQICTFHTIKIFINSVQKDKRNKLKWPGANILKIEPRAGQDLNAYYDRKGLKFFYEEVNNKIIYTCESTDIIAHELGHAVLDCLRPDIFSIQNLETWAYHESFADITALSLQWRNPKMLSEALRETNGDLTKSNIISRLGESVGRAIYELAGSNASSPYFLRDCTRTLKYVDPRRLPKSGKDYDSLIAQEHSFGRILTNAIYLCWVELAKQAKKDHNLDEINAHIRAGRFLYNTFVRAASSIPNTTKYIHAACNLFLIEISHNKTYYKICKDIFKSLNLLPKVISSLSNFDENDFDELHPNGYSLKFKKENKKTFVSDFLISSLSEENIECFVPNESLIVLDENKNLICNLNNDDDMAKESLSRSITSEDWEVKDKKLQRNKIA